MRPPRLLSGVVLCQILGVVLADAGRPEVGLSSGAVVLLGSLALRAPRAAVLGAALAAACAAQALTLARAEAGGAHAQGDRTLDARILSRRDVAGGVELVVAAAPEGVGLRARLYVVQRPGEPRPPVADAAVGEQWRMHLRLRPLRPVANPGASDEARRLARRGVGVRASLVDPRLAVRIRSAPVVALWSAARWLRGRATRGLEAAGPGGGLVRALALGDRTGLGGAREHFVALGVAHLLALSGLHVGLVAGGAYAALRWLLRRRAPSGIGGRVGALAGALAAATGYAAVAGFGVSLQRALLFLAAGALGLGLRRPGAARSALWVAASLLLAVDPASVFDPGPQLSFAATAALLYAAAPGPSGRAEAPPRERRTAWRRCARSAETAVRVSASALAATAPILAAHAMPASPLGLLANALLVPWTGAVLLPTSLIAAAAAVAGVGAPLILGAVAVADATLAAIEGVASLVPRPGPPASPSPWVLAVSFGLAGLALRARATASRTALTLGILVVLRGGLPALADAPRAVVLDVGSGDAILLSAAGHAVLVDGGLALEAGPDLGRTRVVPALAALGVRKLDIVVATHGDADHAGGLRSVIGRLPVERLWVGPGGRADPALRGLLGVAREHGVAVEEISSEARPRSLGDGLSLEPLWPPRGRMFADRNAASLVLLARLGDTRLLLTGDLGHAGERALLARPGLVRADVLKVGHHGSAGSTLGRWLDAVRPAVAIVSAACDRRGLPASAVLDRLRSRDIPVWWTGRDGAVSVHTGPLAVSALAPARSCPSSRGRAPGTRPGRSSSQRPRKRAGRRSTKAR